MYVDVTMCVAAAGTGRSKGGTVQGAAFGGAKIWNSEILHPHLNVLFTVHTNAIVVTIRISIGQWRRQLWGTGARGPLDFQQFHF